MLVLVNVPVIVLKEINAMLSVSEGFCGRLMLSVVFGCMIIPFNVSSAIVVGFVMIRVNPVGIMILSLTVIVEFVMESVEFSESKSFVVVRFTFFVFRTDPNEILTV